MEKAITIAVACYNEEESIVSTLQTLLSALSRCKELKYQIIVMDDASQDRSVTCVEEFLSKNSNLPITLHVNKVNQGLEWNVFKAATLGDKNYFWVVAGDNALSEQAYFALLSHVGEKDIIIPQVISYSGRTRVRKIISKLYVFLVNTISGQKIKYYNGSSLYLREDVVRYSTSIRGFGYSAELILRLLEEGKSYVEVPVVFDDRRAGKSKAFAIKNFVSVGLFFIRLLKRRLLHLQEKKVNALQVKGDR